MVDEGLRAFNVDRLYGGEMKADDLIVCVRDAADDGAAANRHRARSREAAHPEARVEGGGRGAGAPRSVSSRRRRRTPPSCSSAEPTDMRRRIFKLLMKEAQFVDCGTIVDRGGRRTLGEGARGKARCAARRGRRAGARPAGGLEHRPSARRTRAARALRDGAGRHHRGGRPAGRARQGPEAQANFGIANAIERQRRRCRASRDSTWRSTRGGSPVHVLGQLRSAASVVPAARMRRHAIDACSGPTWRSSRPPDGPARSCSSDWSWQTCASRYSRATRRFRRRAASRDL